MSEVKLTRDWLGIQPLHYMMLDTRLIVSSTIKRLMQDKDYSWQRVRTVRSGCEDTVNLESRNVSTFKYYSLPEIPIEDSPQVASRRLRMLLDKSKPILEGATATMLSGGMDSIIVSYLSKQLNPSLVAYTLAVEGQESENRDLQFAKRASERLDLELRLMTISPEEVLKIIDEVVYASEDKRDYNIYSAVGAFLLGKKMAEEGHTKVVCGEGPDEIFGSYDPWYSHDLDPEKARQPEFRRKFVKRLEWNLARGTKTLGYLGMDVVSPYLTKEFVEYAVNLSPETVNTYQHRKGILGVAFEGEIPIDLLLRPKTRFQDGAGITPVLINAGINCDYLEKSFDRQFHVQEGDPK